ncbi:MAG: sigma-70 family RNA polymerase sigma factor [Oscillospiraceae bacterium]|jgi:RNA polymerase sigma-70 factor (ECF subfamily)|nr:sigma-70 family RNA polymerase sigma factor [Oscillospiraceae bacterium]
MAVEKMMETLTGKDERVMEDILRKYGDMVYRVALTHTPTREDAEDAAQEVFLIYARQRPEFHGGEHAKAWFLRVAIRVCGKLRLSAKRRGASPLHENIPSSGGTVGGDVWHAFMSLEKKYRTVVYLYYYERYSVREAAEALDITEFAVKKRLERARGKLREILGGDFDG